MSSGLFKVIVRFQDLNGAPLSGGDWSVRVYDDDPLFDEYLGKADLNDKGEAGILITVADIVSIDSIGERTPDLYFILYHKGKKIFKSAVFDNIEFETTDPVTGESDLLTQSFGPIKVDISD